MKLFIKKVFKFSKKRERLKVIYTIITNKASYIAYNTQTIPGDSVNIEIEEIRKNKTKIILEKEIYKDSLGGLCGDSFYSLVIDSRNSLLRYIKERKEFVIYEMPIK